jgi:hypothetical protein
MSIVPEVPPIKRASWECRFPLNDLAITGEQSYGSTTKIPIDWNQLWQCLDTDSPVLNRTICLNDGDSRNVECFGSQLDKTAIPLHTPAVCQDFRRLRRTPTIGAQVIGCLDGDDATMSWGFQTSKTGIGTDGIEVVKIAGRLIAMGHASQRGAIEQPHVAGSLNILIGLQDEVATVETDNTDAGSH